MALERLPDRLLTGRVARAIMSPSGFLLAGAGASAAILAGLPLLAAAGLGAAAWAARVAMAVPRRAGAGRERIDPFALGEPWRQYVRESLSAQARYRQAVGNTYPGPLKERLAEIGSRIEDGVQECWRIARRGFTLDQALRTLDIEGTRRELAQVELDAAESRSSGSNLQRTAESLRAQLSSAERMVRVADEARDRLRLLDARLDEAVARAVELSLGTGDVDVGGLGTDVDLLVGDMEALRAALEEAGGTASAGSA